MINCVVSTMDGVVCHSVPPSPHPLDKGLNLPASGSAGGPWLSTDVWKWPSVEENHFAQVRILSARVAGQGRRGTCEDQRQANSAGPSQLRAQMGSSEAFVATML